ncbi:MAG: histidine--tRNA ligase [Arenicellales bacterium WSBS_2016_MAG_OTU3]
MKQKLQAVKGMNDILPGEIELWQYIEEILRDVARAYGYKEIRTPIAEKTELFKRGIGEATDVVEKEMYTFVDAGDESLTLRPEQTASCVRAGVQHGFLHNQKQRLWYMGPMFRRERPQKGRSRQFHQFGIEALGWAGPEVDAEILLLGKRLWRRLGVKDLSLQINTLGSDESRAKYRDAIADYFRQHFDALDVDSQRRLERSPLRILDSKSEQTQEIVKQAPLLTAFLDDAARAHFDGLQQILSDNDVSFTVNPYLVRGLDYYTSTVFEWITDQLGAQGTVCAGGRYDSLVNQFGGQDMPGAGFALGMERLVELVKVNRSESFEIQQDVFIASLGESAARRGVRIAEDLRDAGLRTLINCGGGALKRQLKRADDSGAQFAVVIGEDEMDKQSAIVKPLRDGQEQFEVSQAGLIAKLSAMQQSRQ